MLRLVLPPASLGLWWLLTGCSETGSASARPIAPTPEDASEAAVSAGDAAAGSDAWDATPGDADVPAMQSEFIFGMQTQSWDIDVERTLRESAQIGATHATMAFAWAHIEPQPGAFVWDRYDQILDYGQRYGIQIIPQLLYGRTDSREPPAVDAYARYARAVAERYCYSAAFAHILQVWNEPNLEIFWRGTAEEYAAMLDAAYEAIHAGCPDAIVVGFNVAPREDLAEWLGRALATSPRFDWFGWHSYGPPPFQSGRNNPGAGETAVSGLRSFLDARGLSDKPLFDSERGFKLHDGAQFVGALLPQTYVAMLAARHAGVRGLTWFQFHHNGFEDGDLGVVGPGLSWAKRPAYCSFRAMTQMLGAARHETQLMGRVDSLGLQAHLFRAAQSAIVALFAPLRADECAYQVQSPQRVRVAVPAGTQVEWMDWVGRAGTLSPDASHGVELPITWKPTYVRIPLPPGSMFVPSVQVVAPGTVETIPIPVEREVVAHVAYSRGSEARMIDRCIGLMEWHRMLTCCLGPEVVSSAIDPEGLDAVLGPCFVSPESPEVRAAADGAFAALEGLPGQSECACSEMIAPAEQDLLLGRVAPPDPGPACEDY